jgi:hypothetical protein
VSAVLGVVSAEPAVGVVALLVIVLAAGAVVIWSERAAKGA